LNISSNFDSGNIEFVNIENDNIINLKIRKDNNSDFLQWFYFRFTGKKNKKYIFKIINAGKTSYPSAWNNYRTCYSYDKDNWYRTDTNFDGENLTFEFFMQKEIVFFAYFQPYSYERHLNLISKTLEFDKCKYVNLGKTVKGRDIDLLVMGNENKSSKKVWIIARQHPGETMAEWFMEGLIERLTNKFDSLSNNLLSNYTFYLVPNMNVDGSIEGNLRTNFAGANLNREWQEPSLEKSPEVYYVRNKIFETGVDLFLDIHGDEEIPYNFLAKSEGVPSYNDKIKKLEEEFVKSLLFINPDFQDKYGYPKDEKGKANLTIASNYVCETFKCLSMTLEMPFKDNNNNTDLKNGWNSLKCKNLAYSILYPIKHILENY